MAFPLPASGQAGAWVKGAFGSKKGFSRRGRFAKRRYDVLSYIIPPQTRNYQNGLDNVIQLITPAEVEATYNGSCWVNSVDVRYWMYISNCDSTPTTPRNIFMLTLSAEQADSGGIPSAQDITDNEYFLERQRRLLKWRPHMLGTVSTGYGEPPATGAQMGVLTSGGAVSSDFKSFFWRGAAKLDDSKALLLRHKLSLFNNGGEQPYDLSIVARIVVSF